MHVEQRYSHAGPGAFTMDVLVCVDEHEGWLGQSIAWLMTNAPLMMRQQVQSEFARLDEAFHKGIPTRKPGAEAGSTLKAA